MILLHHGPAYGESIIIDIVTTRYNYTYRKKSCPLLSRSFWIIPFLSGGHEVAGAPCSPRKKAEEVEEVAAHVWGVIVVVCTSRIAWGKLHPLEPLERGFSKQTNRTAAVYAVVCVYHIFYKLHQVCIVLVVVA